MKNITLNLVLLFILVLAISCAQQPESDKAEVKEAQKVKTPQANSAIYKVNTDESKVTWIGSKPTGSHNGTIDIKTGVLSVKSGKITGGKFLIDMKTLKALDMDEEGNGKLSGHLKSEDFFKIDKYPTSTFAITKAEPFVAKVGEEVILEGATHTITGNLKMLDVTKSISFPAIINMSEDGLKANTQFNINRTDWGLSYGTDKSLGDRFIKPTVTIGFELVAQK